MSSIIREEILRLQGPERDQAWFNLVEAPAAVLPELMAAYRSERDAAVRAVLVEVIWQHRQPATLDFLGQALHDPDERVWQQALDGIVTIGGPAAHQVLQRAIAWAERGWPTHEEFLGWLDEARDQVLHGPFPGAEEVRNDGVRHPRRPQ